MTAPAPLPAAFDETGYEFRPLPLAIVTVLALIVALLPLPLTAEAHRTLVVLVMAAGLWVTEALPVAVVALLVPVLGTALGVVGARQAFAPFGDPIVFLFFGTFLLTDAAATHGLNARLARAVLSQSELQRRPTRLLWAVALLGGGLSAFMNNTATAALLIPLAMTAQHFAGRRFLACVLLAASYAPSLGGLATPVGTAPNLIGLRLLEEVTGHRPSFAAWCVAFAPLAIAAVVMSTMWLRFRSGAGRGLPPLPPGLIEPLGRPWSRAERTLVPLYLVVVLLWIGPGLASGIGFGYVPWVEAWQGRLPESVVPLLGGLLLFALPSGHGNRRILDASVFRRLDWSTILLFGGGLSLGSMMFESGLARALGEAIFRLLPTQDLFGVVLASTVMAVVMSEMTSNTASAALVVPVVLALAQVAGVDPVKPALAATLGCSFGFMLPISTPPNALVYATGRVRMRTMIGNGMLLDAVGVLLVAIWVTFVY